MTLLALLRPVWLLPAISLSLLPSAPFAKADAEATPARPNILFIILDDWGSKHASAYGCEWVKTPHFDRIAREGALFLNCFTSNPKCGPSRASVLTGRSFFQLEEAANHNGLFPSKFAVYPDLLEQAGYTIGLGAKGWAPGNYQLTGFTRNPAGPGFNHQQHSSRPTSGLSRNDYAGNFEAFLQQRPSGKPFSYWMGIYEPHRVYEQGSGVRLGKSLASIKVPAYLPDNATVRGDLADYAVEVEWADLQIGRTLALLEAAGELDRTLIVVTSDNGMPFPYVKGQIHEDAFHLPLAIRWPGVVQPGRRVHDFVDLRDFAPTFLEIAGLAPHAQMTGRSLVGLLQRRGSDPTTPSADDTMLVGKERHDLGRPNDLGYPVRALRTTEFLYVHNYNPERWPAGNPETGYPNYDDGPTKTLIQNTPGRFYNLSFAKRPAEALYRLADDPEGVVNRAADPAFADVLATLRKHMLDRLKAEQDPRAHGQGEIFAAYNFWAGSRNQSYDTWLQKPGADQTPREAQTAP